MTNSTKPIEEKITVSGQELETVNQSKYLGATLSEDGSKSEVATLKPMWRDWNISLSSMLKLLHALALSIFLHACETWALTAELQRESKQRKWDVLKDYSASHIQNTSRMRQYVQPIPSTWNTTKSCWPPRRKENCVGMVMWQEPVTYRRPSFMAQFKVEEEGAGIEKKDG